ncbi:MAG: DUF4199 domain-containing protein [Siphonobacter aquaeclarae]|nr:DUF4199 domain-containing protein [Siphonobacter aquaeclarae]
MKKHILTFGLLAGVIVSAFMSVSMIFAKNNPTLHMEWGEVIGYSSMLLAFSMIFAAILRYRRERGGVTFKEGLLIGLGISAIASALYVITWIIIYKNVYPDFPQQYVQLTVEKMQKTGKSAEDIQAMKDQMKMMFSWYDTWYGLVGITLMEIFPLGVVVSLVAALILKRKHHG